VLNYRHMQLSVIDKFSNTAWGCHGVYILIPFGIVMKSVNLVRFHQTNWNKFILGFMELLGLYGISKVLWKKSNAAKTFYGISTPRETFLD